MEKVLITGASGLIGSDLTKILLRKGYEINTLGRTKTKKSMPGVRSFIWDPVKGEIDKKAFEGVTGIIHLAGAGIAEKKWTQERKREVLESRIAGLKLIYDVLNDNINKVKVIVSASAVGYYGDRGKDTLFENSKSGKGFLAEVCKAWETQAIKFQDLGIREVRCRIGVVLSDRGGALPELTKTLPLGFLTYFTKLPLYYSWIHIEDVCRIMVYALGNSGIKGAINVVAPEPLEMKTMMQKIKAAIKSPTLLLPVPELGVRMALGEMSEMVLFSQNCSCKKIQESGYDFLYPNIESALGQIYR